MIEPYQWLMQHHAALGVCPENIGPASVDCCLGGEALEKFDNLAHQVITVGLKARSSMLFLPGRFYLASTEETITVPPTHCALVNMRSSWARQGLGHKMAGFIDPGFHGQITLELETLLPLTVPVGERIIQLVYIRLAEETTKPYRGRYLGQRGPTEAYGEA